MGKKRGGKKEKEKTDENSGHYVIASSRPPERRPLERHSLAPKVDLIEADQKLEKRNREVREVHKVNISIL